MKQKLSPIFAAILLSTCTIAQAEVTAVEQPKKSSSTSPFLIGYWQNFKNSATLPLRLTDLPSGYSIVTIAFASVSPDGNVKFTLQGPYYKTMANGDALFKQDIASLQDKGIEVLLSLGGMNSFFHVDNAAKAKNFINSLEAILRDYGFDGVDYDFEGQLKKVSESFLLEITRKIKDDFLAEESPLTITIAPEATDVNWQTSQGKYDALIDSGLIDYVSVQLYNSSCKRSYKSNSPCYSPGTEDFIVSQADSTIQTWKKRGMKEAESKYIIGLPATKHAAGKGYTDPAIVNKALNCLTTGTDCATYIPTTKYPQLGGLMVWSINWDAKNKYLFLNGIKE